MKFKPPPHDCVVKFFRLDFDAKEGIQLVSGVQAPVCAKPCMSPTWVLLS